MSKVEVRLRDDLAEDGLGVPAFDYVTAPDNGHGRTYLFKEDLVGAIALRDVEDEDKPEYNFEHIKLLDGRVFYILSIDLDYVEENDDE